MADNQTPASVLVYLSGSRRGVALTLSGDAIRIGTDSAMDVRLPKDFPPGAGWGVSEKPGFDEVVVISRSPYG